MRQRQGPGLRAVFALLLVGLAASVVAASLPELSQLAFALVRPYHFGAPPSPWALVGTLLVGVGTFVLLERVIRADRAPLWPVALVVLGVALPTVGLLTRDDAPPGRSWAAADGVLLEQGNHLRRTMVDTLRKDGTVPADLEAWQRALDAVTAPTPSPVRDRRFSRVPLRVQRLADRERLPDPADLVPGTYLVWISPERDAFELHPVGFDPRGSPARLTDGQGLPIVLRGGARQENWQPELPRREARQAPSP